MTMRTKLLSSPTVLLIVLTIFTLSTNATAQVETKATQYLTINGGNWNKVIPYGAPVTIFSYKQGSDTYSFGIYSDDYAGIIHMKNIPFDVDSKQLKKLPSSAKKKLNFYYSTACAKAREKALAGKYKTIATDMILSNEYGGSVSKKDTIKVIGYKEERSYVSSTYYYAIIKNDAASICHSYDLDKITIDNVPLPFLPPISDPQVQAVIAKEKQIIKDRKAAETKAYYEKQRKLEEERKDQQFEDLKLMDPAYIEVKGWKMNSAGGINVNIKFTNCSKLRVKYVYFNGYFLNAVGDKCRNDVGGSTVWKNTGVGPISPFPAERKELVNYTTIFRFDDPLFYAKTARKFRLSSVTIEYMNGKKTVLSGAELDDRVDYTDF